jgi:hypothetical protein
MDQHPLTRELHDASERQVGQIHRLVGTRRALDRSLRRVMEKEVRRFYDTLGSDPQRSHAAIARIGRLNDVEREGREGGWGDDRLMAARLERSRPLPDAFSAWRDVGAAKVLPRSPAGEVIGKVHCFGIRCADTRQ